MHATTLLTSRICKLALRLALSGLATIIAGPLAQAAPVDFTGINLATVSSPAGQNFSYLVGGGPGGGTLNVRLLSGPIVQLTTGETPDPTGIWAIEHSDDLSPATFRFTLDAVRDLQVNENETLTAAETNEFTLPSGTWTLLSMVNSTSSSSGSTISFTGTTYFGPYGHYSIAGTGASFDLKITNSPAFFGYYGTAISIDVVPEPTAALLMLQLGAVVFARRQRR